MKTVKVAFDVDGTLIRESDYGSVPRYEIIELLRWFDRNNNEVYIWSGGGVDYAQRWSEKLGLTCAKIIPKEANESIDIAFDDEDVMLGVLNIKV